MKYKVFFAVLFFSTFNIVVASTKSLKTYQVADFNSLLVQSAIEVILKKSNTCKVEVETEMEYQKSVAVLVLNKKLTLKIKENVSNGFLKKSSTAPPKVKIYVYYKNLNELFVTGASVVKTQEPIVSNKLLLILSSASSVAISGDISWLSVNSEGASECNLSGKVNKLSVKCSGASNFNSLNLISNTVDMEIGGASTATVVAQKELVLNVSGASYVKYKAPENIKIVKNILGASTITKI